MDLSESQINTASWEIRDFVEETGGSIEDFAHYFYTVSNALGYDSTKFVELMESTFNDNKSI